MQHTVLCRNTLVTYKAKYELDLYYSGAPLLVFYQTLHYTSELEYIVEYPNIWEQPLHCVLYSRYYESNLGKLKYSGSLSWPSVFQNAVPFKSGNKDLR
jgi:hypothetical protein